VCAWISLAGSPQCADEKAVISFFGIRGLASAYYLAYALNHESFESPDLLWSTIGFVVLTSIVLHGATITPVMRYLDGRNARSPDGRPKSQEDSQPATQKDSPQDEESEPLPAD
jgi:NhaP-type Na+/H+ or K+/H+ antiporter